MPACLYRQLADSQVWVFPEAFGDRADPARRPALRLPARPFQEALQRGANLTFRSCCLANVSEISRLPADETSDPQCDRQTRKQPVSEPGRIELDLDLLESDCRGRIAMTRAGPIEDRGRPRDEPLPQFSLVQIGADHEQRKNGPVVCVRRHAGVAAVDDPPDTGAAEALQQVMPRRLDGGAGLLDKHGSPGRQEKMRRGPRDLESVQYKISGNR